MKAEAVHQKLMKEKTELEEILAKGSSYMREMEEKVKKVENEKREIDRQVSHFFREKQLRKVNVCLPSSNPFEAFVKYSLLPKPYVKE